MKELITLIVLMFIPIDAFSQFVYMDKDTVTGKHYYYTSSNNITIWSGNYGDDRDFLDYLPNVLYWTGFDNKRYALCEFEGSVWGARQNDEIKIGGEDYFGSGLNFGPISSSINSSEYKLNKNRVYKITRNWESLPPGPRKDRFRIDYLEWPIVQGAPYIDRNRNNKFDFDIDLPKFIGDETLWWVVNDFYPERTADNFLSKPFGLEIQNTVFAFNQPEFLVDVIFKKYMLINKSDAIIDQIFFGEVFWPGCYCSKVGTDTTKNLVFAYEYMIEDISPAIGVKLLQGPIIRTNSNSDTARFNGSDKAGYKNIKITASSYLSKREEVLGYTPDRYYNKLRGRNFFDGEPIINPDDSSITTFIFSGNPIDSTGWLDSGYQQGGHQDNNLCRNITISSGPFTMAPDDTQEVVYALIAAQGEDNFDSIRKLKLLADKVQYFYDHYTVDDPEPYFEPLPEFFALSQNYPNPFNPTTTIKFVVPGTETSRDLILQAKLIIYDILGREVATLVNKHLTPGNYEVEFNAEGLSSGVYYYRLEAGSYSQTKKMILLR
ncbi:MAG: T9SS type A sorting domain-containing protein [Melioribacteraceae bacterium]|nr:T9SS type A sorting domain-containing protein [Melioribacteraceae bacterium]